MVNGGSRGLARKVMKKKNLEQPLCSRLSVRQGCQRCLGAQRVLKFSSTLRAIPSHSWGGDLEPIRNMRAAHSNTQERGEENKTEMDREQSQESVSATLDNRQQWKQKRQTERPTLHLLKIPYVIEYGNPPEKVKGRGDRGGSTRRRTYRRCTDKQNNTVKIDFKHVMTFLKVCKKKTWK